MSDLSCLIVMSTTIYSSLTYCVVRSKASQSGQCIVASISAFQKEDAPYTPVTEMTKITDIFIFWYLEAKSNHSNQICKTIALKISYTINKGSY